MQFLFFFFFLSKKNTPFPLDFVLSEWRNKCAQGSLLYNLVLFCGPASELVDFRLSSRTQQLFVVEGLTAPDLDQRTAEEHARLYHCWLSLDLVDQLLDMSEASPECFHMARRVLILASDRAPHLLLSALVQSKVRRTPSRSSLRAAIIALCNVLRVCFIIICFFIFFNLELGSECGESFA